MTLTGIVLLILLGIILILIEIFFIPGVGFVGIVGFLLILVGIYFAYQIDAMTGHLTLVGGAIASGVLGYFAFKPGTWTRVGVKSELKGKSKEDVSQQVSVGDRGKAVSRLAPMGKARFGTLLVEVSSPNEYIDEGSSIEILKIEGNKVLVKKLEE
jgi:membrane-bound ClpP family serine protease